MDLEKIMSLAKKGYNLFILAGNYLQHPLLLLFRINWGIQFMVTGYGKLTDHGKVESFFTSLGIPLPGLNAWIAGATECFGGIFILLGLATRPFGTLLAFTMCVAYLSVKDDRETVFKVFQNPDAFTSATPFMFLVTALLMVCFGPGKLSLDYLLGKYVFNKDDTASGEGKSE